MTGVDRFLTEIKGYSHTGEGVGQYRGKPVFIPLAARGEVVSFTITGEKKNYARGRLAEVVRPQPWRAGAFCPDYGNCGGCQLQHLTCREQLYFKRQLVVTALQRIGGLPEVPVRHVLPMDNPGHYRHTVRLHASRGIKGTALGNYRYKSHSVHPLTTCPVLPPEFPALLADLSRLLDACAGEYPLKEAVVRKGRATGEILLLLKTERVDACIAETAWKELRHLYPGLAGIVMLDDAAAAGNHAAIVCGQSFYNEIVADTKFNIPATAFFQNNPAQTEVLLQQLELLCEPSGRERLLDLYCGVGLFSHYLARHYDLVTGIEENRAAVAAARANAAINHNSNTVFSGGRVEKSLDRIAKGGPAPDTIILDPPRQGCSPGAIAGIAALSPTKIVYVSCNPSTLARDLALLAKHRYRVRVVQPIDMFPHTYHVETAVLLSRKTPDSHINIKVEFGEGKGQGSIR